MVVDFADVQQSQMISLLVDQMRGTSFEALQTAVSGLAEVTGDLPDLLLVGEKIPEYEAVKIRRFDNCSRHQPVSRLHRCLYVPLSYVGA